MDGPGAIRRGLVPNQVGLEVLRERFGSDVESAPPGVVVIAWDARDATWFTTPPQTAVRSARLGTLLAYFSQLGGRIRSQTWWSVVCLDDAWPEGVPFDPSVAASRPQLSSARPWVLGFGRHRGDDSVVLMPDTHYLYSLGYLKMRALLPLEDRSWARKLPTAIYCGGRHGSVNSFEGPQHGSIEVPRERLERLVREQAVPVQVHLGAAVGRSAQLRHRMVLDIDGYARTWDAWAWKARSRSVVLSQSSVWESFFSVAFSPWEHFVPLANDLTDVEEQVSWCLLHDTAAQQIARRATRRAREAYAGAAVRQRVRAALEDVVLP